MLDKLIKRSADLARHRSAPYAEERERYLFHCAQRGYSRATLIAFARELFWVAHRLSAFPPGHKLDCEQLKAASHSWARRERCCGQPINKRLTSRRFIRMAKPWLRFLDRWREPIEPCPFGYLAEDFSAWMRRERGLSSSSIQARLTRVKRFLRWYAGKKRPFSQVHISDVDAFLSKYGAKGVSRMSIRNMADALRAFFRYVGAKGWCPSSIADGIQRPRMFTQESPPLGPSWTDVKRLLASTMADRLCDKRDRAILMLFAIYGLRATEVSHLRLDDIDWENGLLRVARAKRGGRQIYPLVAAVGNAIAQYLKDGRPSCARREVFLTLTAPLRPISQGGLHALTCKHMTAIGIRTPHRGPHALRHACAAHLVSEGLSLKEIGDHLGHRSSDATRIYAKVDLQGLRDVAAFDLGGLS